MDKFKFVNGVMVDTTKTQASAQLVKECLEEARKLLERTVRVDRLYQETTKAVKKVNDQSMQGTPFASTGELDVEEEAYLLRRDKLKEFIEDVGQNFNTDMHKAELAVVWARQEHDTAVFRAMAYNCYKKEDESDKKEDESDEE